MNRPRKKTYRITCIYLADRNSAEISCHVEQTSRSWWRGKEKVSSYPLKPVIQEWGSAASQKVMAEIGEMLGGTSDCRYTLPLSGDFKTVSGELNTNRIIAALDQPGTGISYGILADIFGRSDYGWLKKHSGKFRREFLYPIVQTLLDSIGDKKEMVFAITDDQIAEWCKKLMDKDVNILD